LLTINSIESRGCDMREIVEVSKQNNLLGIQEGFYSASRRPGQAERYDLLSINFESFLNASVPLTQRKAELIRRLLKEFLDALPTDYNNILRLIFSPDQKKFQIYNSVNVCLLSLVIGWTLNYSREELLELGFAALMHDIGMFAMEGLIYTNEILGREQIENIKQHPVHGIRMIDRFTEVTEDLEQAILQEHEREDGSGYPKGINGKHIHEFAKIIAIADCFEALTHYRPYRKSCSPYEAMQTILRISKSQLDARLANNLVNALSFFPPGTCLRLANGEIGFVTAVNKGAPLSPVISVCYDQDGHELRGKKVVDLQKEKDNHVVRVISLESSSHLNH
jgi:HD-GYP domain-containing protein (c-di-GMP phosphodiesterase class II)